MPIYVLELVRNGLNKMGIEASESVIGILGLSYLEESDDVRNSPTISLINELKKLECEIKVHDHYVSYCEDVPLKSLENVISESDALVIMVSHNLYRSLDLSEISEKMRTPLIIDARNVFSKQDLASSGINYFSIGRGNSFY